MDKEKEFERYLNFLNTGSSGDGHEYCSVRSTLKWFISAVKDAKNIDMIIMNNPYLLAILTYFESIYETIEKDE